MDLCKFALNKQDNFKDWRLNNPNWVNSPLKNFYLTGRILLKQGHSPDSKTNQVVCA